jgi:hypothetical protein
MLILVDAPEHLGGFFLQPQMLKAVGKLGQLLGMVRVMVQRILKERRRLLLAAQQVVVSAVVMVVRRAGLLVRINIIVRMAMPGIVPVGGRVCVVMILVMVIHLCSRLSICIRRWDIGP